MPRTKTGEVISWKEFMKRWKQGILAITQLQQVKTQLMGQMIVLIGIITGMVFSFQLDYAWLFLILLGSFFVSGVGMLGTYQRFLALLQMEKMLKQSELEEAKEKLQ